MAGSKQTKRVSWPTDGNLCEVRLFLSEDAPSQSGLGTQDQLQAKPAWLLHAAGLLESDDSLPPGFEAPHKYYHPKIEISQIPLIKWQCPPRLVLNPEWQVVSGEESEEVATEEQRQPGVLEAIYPRPSSIPPNPFVFPDVQAARVDDSCTPLVPITAAEDEDGIEQLNTSTPPNHGGTPQNHGGTPQNSVPDLRFTSEQLQPQSNASPSMPTLSRSEQPMPTVSAALLAEPDVLAAASAAFTAIMKTSEEGSLIDRDLLIKILSDPVMMQRLLSEYGAPKQTPSPPLPPQAVVTTTAAAPSQPPPPPVITTTAGAPSRPPLLPVVSTTAGGPSRPPSSQFAVGGPISAPQTSHIFQLPNHVHSPTLNPHNPPPPHIPHNPPPSHMPARAPPARDVNYYKSLIQLHGGEKQEVPNLGNPPDYHNNMSGVNNGVDTVGVMGMNQRDSKGKVMKPCAYFNTPRGCRHGASCLYQHDASSIPQRIEQQKGTTKRIKLDGGVFGRN